MARVPIACSLTSDGVIDRIEEWRELIGRHTTEAVRTTTGVRIRLHDDDQAVLRAVDLARREKACCAFFDFRLELLTESVWLEVQAPEDAASILDALYVGAASAGRDPSGT